MWRTSSTARSARTEWSQRDHCHPSPARVRRTLEFDLKTEEILHDPEAAALVRREYRKDHWAVPNGV